MEPGGDVRARIAGLVPLAGVIAVDPGGWYPFGPAKFAAVTVAVLVAAATCLWRGVRPVRRRLARALLATWLVLLVWLTIAAAFGVDTWYAWIGTPERRLGVLTWAGFALAAWAGTQLVAGDAAAVRPLRRATAVATAWAGVYGLVELWWRAPIATTAVTDRVGGPFGSAAYFGAALCLLVPVTIGAAADRSETIAWRLVAAGAAVAATVCLVASGTRAAWIGVTFGVAVGAAAMLAARRLDARSVAIGIGLVALAIVVTAPRLDAVTDRSTAWDSRLDEWTVAARVVTERPLLGAGPEGYRIVVTDGIDADYERSYGREVTPDRAHSAPLDVAAIGGVPAAAIYLVLMGLAGLAAWRAMAADPSLVGVAVGVIAYGTQQLLLFPVAELDPAWWLFVGLLAAAPARPVAITGEAPTPVERKRPALALVAAVTACLVFVAGVVEVAADRAARIALDTDSPDHAERAASLRPDVLRYHLLDASFRAAEQSLAGVDAEIAAARRAVDVSPRDPIAGRSLATALGHRATVTGTDADVTAALDAWGVIVADDPHCGVCWYEIGATALLAGDEATATIAWHRAQKLGGTGADAAAGALARLTTTGDGTG